MSEATRQFYTGLYQQHGNTCRALSFTSADTQQRRFAALLPVLPEDHDARFSVLDVGCGFGDLYAFLRESGYGNIAYTGIDIMPEFVAQAAARHPEAAFVTADFLTAAGIGDGYDYVLSSGALNLVTGQHADHYDFVFAMVERMYAVASRGVAFNLLSRVGRNHFAHDPRFFYCDPDRILARCRERAPDTELDHGYLSYDFAIRSRKG